MNVSFAEAVKATSPLFTVVLGLLLIGEHTPPAAALALVPVAGGLALAAGAEASFSAEGFACQVCCSEFIQRFDLQVPSKIHL